MASSAGTIDPKSGYCAATGIIHSLRPPIPLPPPSTALSAASHALSFLPLSAAATPAFVDSGTSQTLTFSEFRSQISSLSSALLSFLPPGSLAFVLSPARLDVPVLFFSLLSVGAVVSPSNPASSPQEIAHQFRLTNPTIAFATSATSHLLPPSFTNVVLLDSPFFRSLLTNTNTTKTMMTRSVRQTDTAAVLYSSGTTGRVKAVVLTHRNFIAMISNMKAREEDRRRGKEEERQQVALFPLPLFHVFGFTMLMGAVTNGVTSVFMDRFDFVGMLKAVERYRVTTMPVSPPLVLALGKLDVVERFDLSSLEGVGCGGAPLGKEVAEKFVARFPGVEIAQGYGLTESTAAVTATNNPEENRVYGSAGRLLSNLEAKIVDPSTGQTMALGKQGELWLRGATIMQGYLGDNDATKSTLNSEGWLKTGDLCYFNSDGFIFIVDRLKELIKYKAYQVPPAELEHILHSHPEISDAAVIPYPHEEAGEIPMAFVVRHPESKMSENEVMDFVAKQVAPYKKIRRVAFTNAIPKSPAGKILRRELVKLAISGSMSKL